MDWESYLYSSQPEGPFVPSSQQKTLVRPKSPHEISYATHALKRMHFPFVGHCIEQKSTSRVLKRRASSSGSALERAQRLKSHRTH